MSLGAWLACAWAVATVVVWVAAVLVSRRTNGPLACDDLFYMAIVAVLWPVSIPVLALGWWLVERRGTPEERAKRNEEWEIDRILVERGEQARAQIRDEERENIRRQLRGES